MVFVFWVVIIWVLIFVVCNFKLKLLLSSWIINSVEIMINIVIMRGWIKIGLFKVLNGVKMVFLFNKVRLGCFIMWMLMENVVIMVKIEVKRCKILYCIFRKVVI